MIFLKISLKSVYCKLPRSLQRPIDLLYLIYKKLFPSKFRKQYVYFYQELLHRAANSKPSYEKIPGRILMIVDSKGLGDLESSFADTILKLNQYQNDEQNLNQIESIVLVLGGLDKSKSVDFPLMTNSMKDHCTVRAVEAHFKTLAMGLKTIHNKIADLLRISERDFALDILNLVKEFRKLRPEIVHAWQDEAAIKCGIAGIIAGVPKIILSNADFPPVYFAGYESQLFFAFQALSNYENVLFLNKGPRGVADYQILFIEPSDIEHREGNCWIVKKLPLNFQLNDSALHWSHLELWEDHQMLGPGNSLHGDIEKYGAGYFSHWQASLLFSTSDNSDPRMNGRIYKIINNRTLKSPDNYNPLLFKEALNNRIEINQNFVPGRIIMMTTGLDAGGAERQLVNTIIGLDKYGFESVTLISEYLNRDFYLPQLQSHQIKVSAIPVTFKTIDQAFDTIEGPLLTLFKRLPGHFVLDILNLIAEFQKSNPEIVHAWQDETSLKCGIAAVLAGVPKIILSSRSVPPIFFNFYQGYMPLLYKALSEFENVIFINNSFRGAEEYAKWLGLPASRFKVIKNGINIRKFLDNK